MMQRSDIETTEANQIATDLKTAFEKFCAEPAATPR